MPGERIKEDRLIFLLDLLSTRTKAFSMAGGWLNQWPWIRYLFPDTSGYTLIKNMNQQISDIIDVSLSYISQALTESYIFCIHL